jgi:hypothetical protein
MHPRTLIVALAAAPPGVAPEALWRPGAAIAAGAVLGFVTVAAS